ncbi:PAS domain-containing protein [Blautia sp. MSJ-19]|uniref:PAS domain-containing protein n=1 Tax=Blautia sp. MSJ-19 TaxID=2841517 RepID=UPI001C0F2F83|nr:PAS domain-containing protein [Blautia sp. MSJ-19]MBU5480280.1 PAS domain-containing protein [Blautia sp. MSJ-19]
MYRETNSKGNKSEEELLTEYSYKALHKLIKSGMWKMYCNREFQIDRVEWSDDLRRMVGYKDKSDFPDLLESWSDLLHPEDHARVINGIDPVLRDVTGNTIFDEEYRLNTRNQGYRWFRATGDVSRREDGTPLCFFGIFIDITEQKEHDRLELARDEALEKANGALTAMNVLHETIGSGAWSNTFNEEGKSVAVEWSDAFRALLGFKNEEDFPNQQDFFFSRVHPDDIRKLSDDYEKALYDTSGKIVYDTEFRAQVKSGEYRWFRTTGRMTRKANEKSGTFYGMLMDIDEKKKTDAELLWRDTLADIMTRNLDSVYVILDKHNRNSVYVSPSIEHVFGIKKETVQPLLAIQKIEQKGSDDFSIEEVVNLLPGQSQVKEC